MKFQNQSVLRQQFGELGILTLKIMKWIACKICCGRQWNRSFWWITAADFNLYSILTTDNIWFYLLLNWTQRFRCILTEWHGHRMYFVGISFNIFLCVYFGFLGFFYTFYSLSQYVCVCVFELQVYMIRVRTSFMANFSQSIRYDVTCASTFSFFPGFSYW